VERWRAGVLEASAMVEAVLDFADEDDVTALPVDFVLSLADLREGIAAWLARPRAETLREGVRIVLAGPPNAGKSTLFNALVEAEAAITAPVAGTTRDVLTRPVAIEGVPFLFIDTAGLRDEAGDEIEAIGVERARQQLEDADLVLWLGEEGEGPAGAWEIDAQIDRPAHRAKTAARHRVSAVTGEGMRTLRDDLVRFGRDVLPRPGEAALSLPQRRLLGEAEAMLAGAEQLSDPLLVAEHLRLARLAFDSLVGRATTEDMLDTLFGRFCIGK